VPSLYLPQAAECSLKKNKQQQQKATLTMTKHTLYLYPQSSKEHSAPRSDSQRYQEKLSSVESIIREMMEETQGLGKHFKVQFRITSLSFITLSHTSMIPEKKTSYAIHIYFSY